MLPKISPNLVLIGKGVPSTYRKFRMDEVYSAGLKRFVRFDLFLPVAYLHSRKKFPFLILNDGQDAEAVRLKEVLNRLSRTGQIRDVLIFAIHAGDRMQEYGVSSQADYKNRGSQAGLYSAFVTQELIPLLARNLRLDLAGGSNAIAGFSLGGLSALDMAWNHPEVFGKVGIFSGSLWWRSRAYDDGFDETKHRIMHRVIRDSGIRENLKFWFQAGTHDELADRNSNGVIDSIDDTLDMIRELSIKGYRPFRDIQYLEIKNGKHHPHTWGKAMPFFLRWAFGMES